ncbi:uncharacterized protein TM35_000342160 [Trypanosoma theileri]|uniref:Uncharacterized protein n=1 Tax=Trypanosoma theileri TaxID=67003 RepID=A0A1X0NLH6_9TRYP|nr:uncharacterized protein TM35_000342160 [Trypanosoma theileri]ORC85604.1 hypothetical protein TM35_000342160 [Trypanosoma theileri]
MMNATNDSTSIFSDPIQEIVDSSSYEEPFDFISDSKIEEVTYTLEPSALGSDSLTQTPINEEEHLLGLEDVKAEEERQRNLKLLEEIINGSYISPFAVGGGISSEGKIPGRVSSRDEFFFPQRTYFTIEPVQIKSNTLETTLNRMTQSISQKEVNGTKKRPLPDSLPQQLNVPLALRCDFCQKFDSLCSCCHKKWIEILRKRRHALAFQSYCRLPEDMRRDLLFLTSAFGVGEFAAMQLDFDGENCLRWRSLFFPLEKSHAAILRDIFYMAGEVYALHVAFAYSRSDVVKVLLESPRSLLLKSEYRLDPLRLLQLPLSTELETVLNASDVYVNHLLAEKAKLVRSKEDWEMAETLYKELLNRKPDSEHAICGLAKMHFDRGNLEDCIKLCDSMISGNTIVDWNEISIDTIKTLREVALKRYHEYSHSVRGEGVLKACGCIILDRVCIPIRKLPFNILVDEILVFCDGEMLWNIFNCSRIPLLRQFTEKLAVLLPTPCIQQIFELESGFQEVYEKLFFRLSESVSNLMVTPVRPLGVSVIAMADFNMFLVRAHAAGVPMKTTKKDSFVLSIFRFGNKSTREDRQGSLSGSEVTLSKQFRIHRSNADESWRVKEIGEWELDHQTVEEVETRLVQR